MFEIKNESVLFRFSFVERIEVLEDRRQDLIVCWLEIEEPSITLQCECELTLFDLERLRDMLSRFYEKISNNIEAAPELFTPRVPVFSFEIRKVEGGDIIGFNFTASPQEDEGWTLKGGIVIDQSYFPGLIRGVESILSN